jgi:hypothetical protein
MGFLPTSSLSQEIRNSRNDINYHERYLFPGRRRDFRLRATALQQLFNPRLCLSHATHEVARDTACRTRHRLSYATALQPQTLLVACDTRSRTRHCLSCATALRPHNLLVSRDCSQIPDSACRMRHPKSPATQNVARDKIPQRMTANAAGGSVETPSNSNPLIGSRVLPLT